MIRAWATQMWLLSQPSVSLRSSEVDETKGQAVSQHKRERERAHTLWKSPSKVTPNVKFECSSMQKQIKQHDLKRKGMQNMEDDWYSVFSHRYLHGNDSFCCWCDVNLVEQRFCYQPVILALHSAVILTFLFLCISLGDSAKWKIQMGGKQQKCLLIMKSFLYIS